MPAGLRIHSTYGRHFRFRLSLGLLAVATLCFACERDDSSSLRRSRFSTDRPALESTRFGAIPGDLLQDERNTIEVFRESSAGVLFVTNSRLQHGFLGLNATRVAQGTGSGFVWDAAGHIVTNFHVIRGGNAFTVSFGDGSTHDAKLVGFDPNKDLAVLKMDPEAHDLDPLEPGSSSNLVVGQKVLAIGNPFGLDRSLSTGVISALGREMSSVAGTTIEDVIQTDASINPGNSGGPLLDSKGRVVGVNTSIVGPAGQSAGIGFAVPIDTVVRIVPQLIRYGKVRQVGIGVRLFPDAVAERWGVKGVIVREPTPGSAASRAGLRAIDVDRRGNVHSFDLIVGVDDVEIRDYDDLYQALEERRAGEKILLQYQRGGRLHEVEVELQELQ